MKKYIYLSAAILMIAIFSILFLYNHLIIGLILTAAASIAGIYYLFRIHSGDLSASMNAADGINRKLGKFNYEVQVAAGKIASVSQQLGITFEENNICAAGLFDKTGEMTELNRRVSADIKVVLNAESALMKMIEQSGATAAEMRELGVQSGELISRNLGSIIDIIRTIDDIRKTTDETVLYMKKLEDTSVQIISILESVENISKQTNLLALNAAIESARAGTSGKGFGVVADEIGKLSIETGDAVKNAGALIAGIRKEIADVSSVITANTSNVAKGVRISRTIESGLEQIREYSGKVGSMINEIGEKTATELELGQKIETMAADIGGLMQQAERSIISVYDSAHTQKHNMIELSDMNSHLSAASDSLTALFDSSYLSGTVYMTPEMKETIKKAFDIITGEVLSNEIIKTKEQGGHRALLERLLKKHSFIEAAWTNDIKGRFIVSIPDAGIANAGAREWFKKSITGESYASGVYISAITKNPCITVSQPIKDNGIITGVAGLDIRMV
ncbi:MAG TPA: methyl-accepting chemotaxis protein [Spirochaetota bacterium]|nr:methyl-accepting chemotaxis protein [Spirochaetota bacterium]HPF06922.1 methyl-accepting chemotaxis protein [Spirochaetota bacterium]HRX49532.1 methyl-accepting chemotaxis protein [Spirochaetota bacterium]